MITPDSDSITFLNGPFGIQIPCYPAHFSYVYILHFQEAYKWCWHYTGSTANLRARIARHRAGNGARLMEVVVHDNHIDFEVARLWRFDTYQGARAFEHKLKQAGHAPRYCPICQHKPFDPETLMYYGHPPLSIHDRQGRRRPMAYQQQDFCML